MSRATGGEHLRKLIQDNRPPLRGGIWLDCYNGIWNEEISGTITTRIDAACEFFVPELSTVSAGRDQATRKAE